MKIAVCRKLGMCSVMHKISNSIKNALNFIGWLGNLITQPWGTKYDLFTLDKLVLFYA
jgi:hypothetical protein